MASYKEAFDPLTPGAAGWGIYLAIHTRIKSAPTTMRFFTVLAVLAGVAMALPGPSPDVVELVSRSPAC
jgi:hypothetical protein